MHERVFEFSNASRTPAGMAELERRRRQRRRLTSSKERASLRYSRIPSMHEWHAWSRREKLGSDDSRRFQNDCEDVSYPP